MGFIRSEKASKGAKFAEMRGMEGEKVPFKQ
jgi:hypothetical protein